MATTISAKELLSLVLSVAALLLEERKAGRSKYYQDLTNYLATQQERDRLERETLEKTRRAVRDNPSLGRL